MLPAECELFMFSCVGEGVNKCVGFTLHKTRPDLFFGEFDTKKVCSFCEVWTFLFLFFLSLSLSLSRIMFLNESEVELVLKQPIFSLPVTESDITYHFYRGRKNVNLLTVRFNMTPTFNASWMRSYLQDRLTTRPFQLQSQLVVSVHYDLLLCDTKASPPTYYIWVSNTNRTTLDVDQQTQMTITYDNISRLTENVTNVNVSDLQVNFINSDITVDRVLAIVFTFEH